MKVCVGLGKQLVSAIQCPRLAATGEVCPSAQTVFSFFLLFQCASGLREEVIIGSLSYIFQSCRFPWCPTLTASSAIYGPFQIYSSLTSALANQTRRRWNGKRHTIISVYEWSLPPPLPFHQQQQQEHLKWLITDQWAPLPNWWLTCTAVLLTSLIPHPSLLHILTAVHFDTTNDIACRVLQMCFLSFTSPHLTLPLTNLWTLYLL